VKVVIAGGAGGVGASVAFNLLLGSGDHEVVLLDRRPEMVLSHALDLEQVLEQGARGSIRGGGDEDLPGADIVIVTASAPLTVNDSRMVYLEANARILADVVDVLPAGWRGVLLVVTNPVDPLCTWLQRSTGLPRQRVLGYTLNDSLRLKTGIGKALGTAPGRVEAWTIGEHGSLTVPLFDRITVDGAVIELSQEQRAQVEASGRMKVDDEIIELKEWDAVRVPPGTGRGYEAGPEGLEILVIGAPNLGQAVREDVHGQRDWWAD
jgi:malate dehydrogenase